jgi:NAD(P)-dependent dehydrogenase (short-subunit alcohol dehydrogenase family)
MPRALSEHVVVLTGASSGVGRETALHLAQHGPTVVAAARNDEALDTLRSEVERLGGTITTLTTDVSQWEQVQALAQRAEQEYGRIDTWVNGAAVSLYGTVADLDVAEIDRVLDVILRGQIYGMKAALEVMRPAGTGTIINVASALAVRSVPLQSAYCAAKHGVRGFSQSLRMELEHEHAGAGGAASHGTTRSWTAAKATAAVSRLGAICRSTKPALPPDPPQTLAAASPRRSCSPASTANTAAVKRICHNGMPPLAATPVVAPAAAPPVALAAALTATAEPAPRQLPHAANTADPVAAAVEGAAASTPVVTPGRHRRPPPSPGAPSKAVNCSPVTASATRTCSASLEP